MWIDHVHSAAYPVLSADTAWLGRQAADKAHVFNLSLSKGL